MFLALAWWPFPSVLSVVRSANLSLMQCITVPRIGWVSSPESYFSFIWFVVTSYLFCLFPPLLHLCSLIFCMLFSSSIGLRHWILSSSVLMGFISVFLLICFMQHFSFSMPLSGSISFSWYIQSLLCLVFVLLCCWSSFAGTFNHVMTKECFIFSVCSLQNISDSLPCLRMHL